MGVGSPATGDMTEFGAVVFDGVEQWEAQEHHDTFHGAGCGQQIIGAFGNWINQVNKNGFTSRPTMISDNPAYDWQWINFYFHKYFGNNPLGFSARRIGDFYAGLTHDWHRANIWKRLRVTKHDHNPVHDAIGNVEAFVRMLKGERA